LRPLLPRAPIAVALRQEAGQLVIGWNHGAVTPGSRLEILDGSERTVLLLPPDTFSATYAPWGNDVEVRLATQTGTGAAHWEAAHFASGSPLTPAPPAFSALRDRIRDLSEETRALRDALVQRQTRSAVLAAQMNAMTAAPPVRPEP
jgi:hypothetical protein